jgi:hypothetical protein
MNTPEYDEAMDLFIQSLLKPDHELRTIAKQANCLDELLQIRDDMVKYLQDKD